MGDVGRPLTGVAILLIVMRKWTERRVGERPIALTRIGASNMRDCLSVDLAEIGYSVDLDGDARGIQAAQRLAPSQQVAGMEVS